MQALRCVEFRIPMPVTLDEYEIGSYWSYLRAVELQEAASAGSTGVTMTAKEEFEHDDPEDPRMEAGVRRVKTINFGSHIPAILRGLAPDGALNVTEESFDSFPFRRSVFRSAYLGDSFHLEVEQMIVEDDRGELPNALNLAPEYADRPVEYIDIQGDDRTGGPLEGPEDITTFRSEKTNRGPLKEDFYKDHDPVTTVYCVAKLRLVTPMLQSTAEDLLISWGVRDMLLAIHRRAFCLIDEWIAVTREELDEYEDRILFKKNKK